MSPFSWKQKRPQLMGILNVTPDSFSDGGQFVNLRQAVDHALLMEAQGADLIDIGGESTRPGSDPVTPKEQMERVLPVIEELSHVLKIPISIDTTSALVAEASLEAGALIVNDISAGLDDERMMPLVSSRQCPVILMHRKAQSKVMQKNVSYDDVVTEVLQFLIERAQLFEQSGCHREQIAIDPGIGFGKLDEHNKALTQNLMRFVETNYGVLYGVSRKSWIGRMLNISDPHDRDMASAWMGNYAVKQGVHILRVHDVSSHRDMLRLEREFVGQDILANQDFEMSA